MARYLERDPVLSTERRPDLLFSGSVRKWSVITVGAIAFLCLSFASLAAFLAFVKGHRALAAFLIGAAVFCLAGVGWWWRGRRRSSDWTLSLGDETLEFAGPNARRGVRIRYDELQAFDVVRWRGLSLVTAGHTHFVPRTNAGPNDHETIRAALVARITALPIGAARLASIEARRVQDDTIAARATPVTWLWTSVVVLVFLLSLERGGVDFSIPWIRWLVALGANATEPVAHGAWWRLFAANLIHLHLFHLAMNLVAILAIGRRLERVIGSVAFATVVIAGGFGGALASALRDPGSISVGASTAVFALLGVLLVLHFRGRQSMPSSYHIARRSVILIVVVECAMPMIVPGVDGSAHFGGAVAGILIGLLIAPIDGRAAPRIDGRRLHVVAALLVTIQIGASGFGVFNAYVGNPGWASLAEAYRGAGPGVKNSIAWTIVWAPDATEDDLRVAETISLEAIAAADTARLRASFADTHAFIARRLGKLDVAIESETRAVREHPDATFATALARFLDEADTPRSGTIHPSPSGWRVDPPETAGTFVVQVRSQETVVGVYIASAELHEEIQVPFLASQDPAKQSVRGPFLISKDLGRSPPRLFRTVTTKHFADPWPAPLAR